MNHSPLSAWADENPSRWPAVAVVVSALVLGAYGFMFVSDEMEKHRAVEEVRAKAEQAELQRKDLQDKCGGPEATVTATATGCESINKRGKKTVISRSGK